MKLKEQLESVAESVKFSWRIAHLRHTQRRLERKLKQITDQGVIKQSGVNILRNHPSVQSIVMSEKMYLLDPLDSRTKASNINAFRDAMENLSPAQKTALGFEMANLCRQVIQEALDEIQNAKIKNH